MKVNKYKEIKNKYIGLWMSMGIVAGIIMWKFLWDTSMWIAVWLWLWAIVAVAKFEYDKKNNKLK